MKKITRKKLEEALVQECLDQSRYLTYAERAREEGFSGIARLFQTIAFSERVHSKKFLKLLGELGSTKENLQYCLESEKYQTEEFYPSVFELAGMMNEIEPLVGYHSAQQTENIHSKLFERALESINDGKDLSLSAIHICKNCGFTLEGSPPPTCAICGLPKENFKEF